MIGKTSFLKNNGGAIPSNVLTIPNTSSNDAYLRYCRKESIDPHPARMPPTLPEFFIRFLTKPRNLVFDPFSGSNCTGAAAESLKRRWLGVAGEFVSIRETARYFSSARGSLRCSRCPHPPACHEGVRQRCGGRTARPVCDDGHALDVARGQVRHASQRPRCSAVTPRSASDRGRGNARPIGSG